MKRIIEIPDKVVEAIQNGEDYRYDIHTAIAQSKPYDDSGDLISRNALIREIGRTDEWYKGRSICNIIDNAPTVEAYTSEDIVKYISATEDLVREKLRPQGDLISRSALYRKIKTECNPYGKPTIDFESGKRVLDIIDNAPTVPQVTVFAENADEKAVADLKAELQNVLVSGRPQGDLISREALKDEVRKHAEYYADRTEEDRYNVGYTECACEILDFIDNAPLVFAYTEDDMCQATVDGYDVAKKQFERPQGEWKFTTHHARRYRVCPFCAAEKLDDLSAGWNFCWHCGAQMKGGAE